MNKQTALPEIVIPIRRSRVPILFFTGLLVSSISLYLFITDDGSLPFFYYRAFYLVLFGYAAILTILSLLDYIKTVFDKNASLVLSDKTMKDDISILSCGSVPWEDVTDVSIKKTKRFNFQFLIVTLADDEKYLKNKNPLLRYILKRYIKSYGGIMVISDRRVRYDLQQLKNEVLKRMPR
jgi:hypothetical protein